ncbi:MAG: error-prone DNA polymerase [Candidatus Dormibacteraeota bacterium]|uniref:DNA-directed DNA polymerase n=1 Tax=Candidatus Dormiibacter inghamiae TaxID=3127013 RepID=A0A934NHK8_9BACT|nr:error-prone DNA polymerase [Candidatus Dormibacteraeota bacterium]MBJ7607341.1 error-prone DNA polymerase [Candidatus Dormibacteraeota bacterium]
MNPYVELHCHSNFSFLDGGSHPAELALRAAELEMPALALTDTGGVYGAVRFLNACRQVGVRPIIGACLEVDGQDLTLLARTFAGYSNLCRLLSVAHKDQPKGEARTTLAALSELCRDLFILTATDEEARLRGLQEALGSDQVFVELQHHLRPEDDWLLAGRAELARRCRAPVVATNDVRYHYRSRRPLHDVLTAIRHRATLETARHLLPPNSERVLKSGAELQPLFKGQEEALAATFDLAQECKVDLDFRRVRFPGYPVPPGETPFSHLYQLAQQGARRRYHPITPAVARRLQRELEVIEKTGLAEFFLINWDLMRFGREHGVPGQGRGSAADSIIAYVLGITRVDPIEHNLLFERFLHEEMTSAPDIDIDFSTEHREQVIQYVYDKYGWDRTGMVCNVVTFRPRMAIRQVGKALGFPIDLIDRLAKGVDRWFEENVDTVIETAGAPPERFDSSLWQHFRRLVQEVQGFPRHLSIHVGGMLVTGEPLVDIVPVEPATMPGRVVVQFDKNDIEDLGLIKIDMLGLRTLSVVAETLELIERSTERRPDLDELPLNDAEVYEMCSRADTIGVFQIESRAQMMTLPRIKPNAFNDLVVEVAIIRPGPIQGNAVHPYIRRKQGRESVIYAHPLLEPVLRDTLGVILYQEQILEIAMQVAGMSPAGADRFRRAMTRHLNRVEMSSLEGDFVNGCLSNGVPKEVADELFSAVQGFAVYGFCRSHAAAFARTTYETAWLKLHHPAEFCCGLLNNQPMGFYHPSVLVEDAKRHGVKVLPVDINRSAERCLPVTVQTGQAPSMRIGFNYLRDLGEPGRLAIIQERERGGHYRSLDDFLERLRGAPLNPKAVRNLVMVGAFDALHGVTRPEDSPRRALLWGWQERWDGRGLRRKLEQQSELRLPAAAPPLPSLSEEEVTRLEYRIANVSTGRHLIEFHREQLQALGVLISAEALRQPAGRLIRVGGLVITRQAPSTANQIRFFTLEDERGHVNLTIKPEVYQQYRRDASAPVLVVDGKVQTQDGVWSLLVTKIAALPGASKETSHSHDYK